MNYFEIDSDVNWERFALYVRGAIGHYVETELGYIALERRHRIADRIMAELPEWLALWRLDSTCHRFGFGLPLLCDWLDNRILRKWPL